MATPKSLGVLLRVKRRRIEQFEAHVKDCAQQLQACHEQQLQAGQARERCAQAEAQGATRIDTLSSRPEGFLGSDLITLQHVLDTLRVHSRQADQVLQRAIQQVDVAQEQLRAARQAVKRVQMQVDMIEAQRKALLLAREQAMEDTQDEESEEAAVARMLAHAKAAETAVPEACDA